MGKRLVQKSRVQYPKIGLYWAAATVGLTILWSFILRILQASGLIAILSFSIPVVLGSVIAVVYYFAHDHQTLDYDDHGYSVTVGKKRKFEHQWPEFQTCSIVRDNYGKSRIRLYTERDGHHLDVDSSVCGVDPYKFRDFASARLSSHVPQERPSDLLRGLERDIQRGRAYWVADLSETFMDYQLSGEVFPLFARGGTRPKGFLLSRMFAYTIMPNYNVCMYVNWVDRSDSKAQIMRLLRIVETQRDQKNIKWSWLLLLGDESAPTSVSKMIGEFGNRDIGIGYVNVLSGEIIVSPNQLGRSMVKQMRLNRLIRDLQRHGYLA